MEGPMMLDGCRVLDLTDERGLLCGQLLADLGATVVHVELPGGSDARKDAVLWGVHTRNQQSVLLDVRASTDRARLMGLVERSDILVESGAWPMGEIDLDFETLVGVNPSLVYVSISPFGATGPKRHYQATDLTVQASAGSMAITGFADRAPLRTAGVTAWSHAGAAAAGAALMGLRLARRTGQPSHIDVSAQEATTVASAFTLLNEAIGNPRSRRAASDAGLASGIIPCADGFVINSVAAIGPMQHFLARQVKWMAGEGAIEPELADAIERGETRPGLMVELAAAIRAFFATRTKQQLLDAAVEHGLVLAPLDTTRDVLVNRQFTARDVWWRDGDVTMPGPFARFSAPLTRRRSAPQPGEHDEPPLPDRNGARPVPTSASRLPLEGVKVLDFGWIMAGPYATRVMADYGATVVKVESARKLDLLRLLPPYYSFGTAPENSASFACVNAGKQSLALDLSHPDGRQVALDLVDWADVVCEAFAPGAMQRLGLDYDTLRQRKPDLVMVSSSLYGHTGPYTAMAGYGTQGSGMAGIIHGTGYPDRPPIGPAGPFTDFVAPRYQLVAILAALEHRDWTGQGHYIDLAQAESGLQAIAAAVARSSRHGTTLDREANTDPAMRPHGVYPAAGDDEWIAVAIRDAADWQAVCAVIGRDDLAGAAPPDDADEAIADWTRRRPAEEAERILQEARVPAHHVVNATTAGADDHLAQRRMFVTTTYGGHEALVTSTGYHFSSAEASVGRVPRIGEDTVEVLRDRLGYSPARIEALATAGAIAVSG
jgi:crotonobetainyl-CoA:carnitine CoA-transferase CaiB-like acyl-CoA transferase